MNLTFADLIMIGLYFVAMVVLAFLTRRNKTLGDCDEDHKNDAHRPCRCRPRKQPDQQRCNEHDVWARN